MTVDSAGLTIPTIEDLLSSIAQDQKDNIDSTLITEADELLGQLNGTFVSPLREAWEVLQIAYNGFNPDDAEGFLLEAIAAISGTVRRIATVGYVDCEVNLDAGTTLLAGVHSANVSGDPTNLWVVKDDFTAPSDGTYTVRFIASESGSIAANAGTVTNIATPLSGWNNVTNPLDATRGRNVDTDEQLRERREVELAAVGSGTVQAIRAAVSQVDSVVNVTVIENTSNRTDSNGIPGHHVEVLVFDGVAAGADDDEIAQAIFENRCAGVGTFGIEQGTATDSFGDLYAEKFNRPNILSIYIAADYELEGGATVDETALKQAIVDHMVSVNDVGKNVYLSEVIYALLQVSGIDNVPITQVFIGTSPSPTSNVDLPVQFRAIADFDTARITLNSV